MRTRTVASRWTLYVLFLLVLPLASCGSLAFPAELPAAISEGDAQSSPLTQLSPLATPSSGLAQGPLNLVVLHTNDNWGETEPCG